MWLFRSFVLALPRPLDRVVFPFGSWWIFTVRLFSLSRLRDLADIISRTADLAYRVSSVNWGRLGPAHMSLQLAALPPGKMRLTQGLMFRFFFQGLLSLGHLGALLQIRLPGYHLHIRDFKELAGLLTRQASFDVGGLPSPADLLKLGTIYRGGTPAVKKTAKNLVST